MYIRWRRVVSCLTVLILIISLVTASAFAAKKKTVEIKEPTVEAGSYIVMSGSTSEVILAEHADRKLPMGNITKLMTAMMVIDNLHDDSEYTNKVTVKAPATKYGEEFLAGESVTVEDMLVALLVGGSDEAAEVLAEYSMGDRDAFIAAMNSKAIELGLDSTKYRNPTGRYNVGHYSSASDCALVAQAAIRYAKIKKIMALDTTTIKIYDKAKGHSQVYTNTNPLRSSVKVTDQYRYIKGGIAGTLAEPKELSQYIGIATKNQMQYVVVMLEADPEKVAQGAIDLFEYGDIKATKNTIIKADKYMGKVKVKGGSTTRAKVYTETKGFAYIPPEGSTDLVQTETVLTSGLVAPLNAGDKVGEYRIYVADELKGTVDLVIKKDIKKGWILSNIYISNFATVVIVLIILTAAYLILRIQAKKKHRARMKERARQKKIREMAEQQAALDEDRRRRQWTYSKYYDSKDMQDALKRKK